MTDTPDPVLLLDALDDDALLAAAFRLLDHERVGNAIREAQEINSWHDGAPTGIVRVRHIRP